ARGRRDVGAEAPRRRATRARAPAHPEPAHLAHRDRVLARLLGPVGLHARVHALDGPLAERISPDVDLKPHRRRMGTPSDWRAGASVLPRPATPRGAPGDTTGR